MKYSYAFVPLLTFLRITSAADAQQGAKTTAVNGNDHVTTNQVAASATTRAGNNGASPSVSTDSSKTSLEYNVIEFENFGYEGYYYNVKKMENVDDDDCTCTLSTDETAFSGANAPINQEVSLHFRGPLILSKFAYYIADNYIFDDTTSSNWSRLAYYDAESQTSENVTFLTAAGDNSTCLGKALTYADTDGLSEASSSTILAADTLINSDDEFIIFSNVSCDDSGYDNDCGVYRSGIPAYHGFYGDTKAFLFEFEMPSETVVSEDDVSYYDMPAIWMLNAHIPRTAQYPTNSNCSCWTSGCGEFDIFEILNTSETTHLYSTIHDYQGTGDINTGLQAYGYIERDTSATMRGGVVFDSNGTAKVFITNDTSFDSTILGTDLQDWINDLSSDVDYELDSVASTTATTSSSSDSTLLDVRSSFVLSAIALNLILFVF